MNPIVQQIAKHPLVALLATIVVGSLGSGFWDIAVKPGIGWVGSALLNIITLGSESIRDNAYAAATMEPTSIPSLKLYLLLLCFLSTPILFSLLLPSINPRKEYGGFHLESLPWRTMSLHNFSRHWCLLDLKARIQNTRVECQ